MQGYPSKRRAHKAFDRGVATGFAKRAARCPYRNEKLAALWERGRQMGLGGRKPRAEPKAKPARPAPPARRPFSTRRDGRAW